MIRRIHAYDINIKDRFIHEGDLVLSPRDVKVILDLIELLYPDAELDYMLGNEERMARFPKAADLAAMRRHVVRWIQQPDNWVHPSQYRRGMPLDGRIDPR